MLAVSHGPYLGHLRRIHWQASVMNAQVRATSRAPGSTGPMFQGYWLGPGRTVVCGRRPTSAQLSLLEANAAAVGSIVAAIRAGVTVRELVAIGDRHTAAFAARPASSQAMALLYGHGNGLFFEAPTISIRVGNDADFVLRENMVVSIEVFFSRDGWGRQGFENNVIVTGDGSELLSRVPMLF